MRYSFLILFILFLTACKTDKKEVVFSILTSKKSTSEQLKLILSEEYQEILDLSPEKVTHLNQLYASRKFKGLWLKNKKITSVAKKILFETKDLLAFGLPQNRIISISDTLAPILKEIYLTSNLLCIANDLKHGFFVDSTKKIKPPSYFQDLDFLQDLTYDLKNNNTVEKILRLGPQDTIYQKLAKEIYNFAKKSSFKDSNLHVPTYKKDTIHSIELAKKALLQKNYTFSDSIGFINALKDFQLSNGLEPDGKIGQHTVDALNETNLHKLKRAFLTLEKLRWQKNDYSKLVLINVPEFTLRFYAEDSLKSVHKIIVGKPDKQTPELHSLIYKITTLPFWSVPFSITSEEFLPILKQKPNYLTSNNMLLYRKQEEIDPLSVNWQKIKEKTFPFRVVQQPGKSNSLGIIKFEFLNKYGVYVHDTPNKHLFKTYVRAYSHGCMRCENPSDLAKIILEKDKNNLHKDSLDSILVREEHLSIKLNKKIPIIVEYKTVVISENNKILFLRDIYRKDDAYLKKMF